ncbi:DsbA family protein [Cnuibacter physcomitrellae]|uniref:DsbA family protein n=1 Tax=Cnuibacter physcomitrellae TaxID=1619308 RepID=UPI002175EC72|nr:DsbA family protein [Cnuibacter physcomitrellae]MCS5495825.1 DsbA family protein [Cnuibacter physcomitrellae]
MASAKTRAAEREALEGLPKKERQALQREFARLHREEEARRRRRTRVVVRSSLVVVGVAVLAITGVVVYNSIRATFTGPLNMLSDGLLFSGDGSATTAARTAAIPPGGQPTASSTDTSKVLAVREYVDYGSADTATFETTNGASLQSYVTPGYATLEIHPVALDGDGSDSSYSARAANAMACTANYVPDSGLAVHNALIKAQSTLPDGGLSNDDLVTLVQGAGVTDDKVASCIRGNEFDDWVKDATDRARASIPDSDVTSLSTAPLIVVDNTAYTGALDDANAFTEFIAKVFGEATGADTGSGSGTDGGTGTDDGTGTDGTGTGTDDGTGTGTGTDGTTPAG